LRAVGAADLHMIGPRRHVNLERPAFRRSDAFRRRRSRPSGPPPRTASAGALPCQEEL
jgi:hypothetical protein